LYSDWVLAIGFESKQFLCLDFSGDGAEHRLYSQLIFQEFVRDALLIRPQAASRLFRYAHPYLKVRACFASARGYTTSIPLVAGID